MDAPYVAVATTDELAPGQMKPVRVGKRKLLLVNASGRYYLVDEMCSHEDYSLALGCIKGERIKCSLHGSYFDLRSGKPLDEPACDPIGTYRLKIAEGQIWVDPGIEA